MMDTAAVSSVLDELYHSTLDPERLPNALSKLGDAFGCEHVALIDRNVETFDARLVTTRFDDASRREFIDVWSHHDIIRLRTRHWQVGAIETDRHIVPRQEYVASDYYNGFLKPRDIHAQMRVTLGYEGKFRRIMTLMRPHAAGDFDDEAIAPCRLLLPHLQRVSQMVFRADGLHAMLGALSDVADRSVAGILLVGSDGKISFANRAAQAIAEAGDAILLGGGQFRVHDRTDSADLQRLIAGATGALREIDAARGGVVRLARQSGKAPYVVTVAPVARGMSPAGTEPMALVLIADPDAAPKPPQETLKQLFGFSATEIRVAERLVAGDSPEQAAASLDVKTSTVRWHLASMYRKTGTKRQTELVRLLLSLAMI